MRDLPIRTELSAAESRAKARQEARLRMVPRLYATTHVLRGVSRAEAARLCSMDRQPLHDAAVRFNADGLGGLIEWPQFGRKPRLSERERLGTKRHLVPDARSLASP